MDNKKLGNIIVCIEAPLLLLLFVGLFIDGMTPFALVASIALCVLGLSGFVYGLMHRDYRLPAYVYICGTDFILGLAVLFFKFIL